LVECAVSFLLKPRQIFRAILGFSISFLLPCPWTDQNEYCISYLKKKNSIEVSCNVFLGESTFPRKRYTEMFEICRTWISTEPNLTYRDYLDNLLLKPITVYCIWSMWEHNNSVCLIWHNKFATFPTVVLATMKIPKDKHCSD